MVTGSLTFAGGSIAIQAGGNIKLNTPLYVADADADGWPTDFTLFSATSSGRRRLGLMRDYTTADCGDSTYSTTNQCCVTATYYQDADGDTYGNPSISDYICPTSGWVSNNTDCNDTGTSSQNVWLSATCYVDADNDNYGSTTSKSCTNNATCGSATWASGAAGTAAASGNFSANNTDCDDGNAGVTGAATWYQDSDSDTYGNASVTQVACSQPGGYVANSTDCYDSNANAKPGQTSCYSSHRGDGSYDYNCVGGNVACNSCSTSRSIDGTGTAWRQCLSGLCWTDPANVYFFAHRCSGSTSTCGASGYTCSSSKASTCSAPCTLSGYLSSSSSGCSVSCK
jgi:hypothetical protein